jgi:hypothetical protein
VAVAVGVDVGVAVAVGVGVGVCVGVGDGVAVGVVVGMASMAWAATWTTERLAAASTAGVPEREYAALISSAAMGNANSMNHRELGLSRKPASRMTARGILSIAQLRRTVKCTSPTRYLIPFASRGIIDLGQMEEPSLGKIV